MKPWLVVSLLCLSSCATRQRGALEIPLKVTVHSSPPANVSVIPREGSKRQRVELGRTPVDEVQMFAGDTVVLRNEEVGIEYEEFLSYGEPNSKVLIDKTFRTKAP